MSFDVIGKSRAERVGWHRPWSLAAVLALSLVVPTGLAPLAQAKTGGLGRPDVPEQRVSKVKAVFGQGAKKARQKVAEDKKANARQAEKARAERETAWPKAGEATVELTADGKGEASPGGLPLAVTPESKALAGDGTEAHVSVLDQKAADKAGVLGVLLSVEASAAGSVDLSVDYSGFAGAVGGGWAQRLGLVRLPSCALTTPEKAECREQRPLKSRNDTSDQTVSARVPVAEAENGMSTQLAETSASVLAVTATAATGESPSGLGTYTATPLAESSKWEAGGSSGSFTWSYDFTMPPAAAGPVPGLSLSYDSGGIDGRTASTNNQSTTVGEGFALTESYIERSYGSCDQDGHEDVFDQCWKYDNARLVLNGKSNQLVKDGTSGEWRLKDDDASKVIRDTGADNGDNNGEHWTVITGDGTKYVFGLDKLDGAGDERTNSTWTVPVFGDDSGEPGYDAGDSFGDRDVTQAWRWNLDHVVDTHGNAATYWYAKETNHYKKNKATTANASYTRGGYLKEIKYGLRKGALFTDDADAKVTFSYAERCTASDCAELTEDTAENWPDVPFDAICASGADEEDCKTSAPSFFTRKRLTDINTYSWSAATSAYAAVDSWALTQKYLDGGDIGDSSDQTLTLTSIKRTGKAGTDIALDPLSFTYQMRPNRVDGVDDILPLTRPRLSTITSETGAITTVTLSSPECVRSEVVDAAEDTNTRSCYPQYWNINGGSEASVDWFHKYRVLAVVVSDPAGQNDAVEHSYAYEGAAWRHNDDPLTPEDERTWSDWRGYRQVTSYTGATDVTRSKTVSLYLQGMNGDKKKDGTTKSVTLAPLTAPDLGIASTTDSEQYGGQLREEVTYNGSTPVTVTVNDPWSKETARQDVPDASDAVARFVRTEQTTTHTYLTGPKTWRARATTTGFDSYGMAVTVDDSGEVGKGGDQTCTRTWYARNADAGITSLTSRVRTVGRSCSVTDANLSLPADSGTRGDILSDSATVYDSPTATAWSENQQPTKGAATWSGRATGYPTTATDGQRPPTGWQTTGTTTYDTLGRTLSTADSAGNATTTAYTPTDAGPPTRTVTTNAKGHRTINYLDPRRGQADRSYDANAKKTEFTYDALGRLTAVWLPNRNRAADQSANGTFAYHLSNTEPSSVSTSTLKADGETYNTTYEIYDALLRKLQTQAPSPQGGRLLTDTRYDSRGLAYETYEEIFDSTSTPNGTYTRAEYGEAPKQTETVYDGAERTTASTLYVYGVKKWTTTTSHTGDSTATTALQGGSALRTVTDARGRTVETREYEGTSPADADFGTGPGTAYASVKFGYTLDDKEKSITGADGSAWTYGYDLFGRRVDVDDPDKGKAETEYNALDQAIEATDARGRSILTAYDEIGRVTGTWAGSKTDANQLTAHTYDTVIKGKPASSTRYVGGRTGTAYTKTITAYDSQSRPVATKLELPADDPLVKAGAPSVLESTSYYNINGTLQNTQEPALGGLPSETVGYEYTGLGNVTSISGSTGYLLDVAYSALGQAQQLTLGVANTEAHKKAYVTNTYEEGTGRLTRSHVTDQTHPYMLQDLNYAFDQAGNVTSIADPATLGGSSAAETQCYAYDGHRRMTEAWTPASQNCADTRSASSLSGPAPYWTSYTYDAAGQRTGETTHTTSATTTTTYCYEGDKPHALTGTSTDADCAAPDEVYGHDEAGNTDSRPGETAAQDLDWSDEGKLAKITEGTKATDYLYDAEGTLLIRATSGGERVLYAGATELHLRADGTMWAQRTYGSGDLTVAVRSNESGGNKLFYLAGDHHGTQSLALTADTQAVIKRRTTPFGAERGTTTGGDWPTDKGFLGKTTDDTTGLTHIAAREYDPGIGQFISVDPALESDKPQTMSGYAYAANNPATFSDPTGQILMECHTGEIKCVGGKPVTSKTKTPRSRSGGGGQSSSGTASGSGGTGHYVVGSAQEPYVYYKDDFPYDPSAEATASDYTAWLKWQGKNTGAFWCSWISACDTFGAEDGNLSDAVAMYAHYMGGSGLDAELDYEKAYDQDKGIRAAVDEEIALAQTWAEKIQKSNKKSTFDITGKATNVGGSHYPETENWQKAIGEHKIWGSASVKTSGDSFTMRITIRSKDRYDFNKGMSDIASGTPDEVNGRFATLGWAKPFISRGTVTREVTWRRGDILGSTSVSGGGR
ncbi:RHS repeat-associated core domain-containing protein [Streptomyces sp. NPDC002643]